MDYQISKDKIIITDISQFNIEHILECGQVFRYKKIGENYVVFSKDKMAQINVIKNKQNEIISYEIITKNTDYFTHYFDLNTNYNKVKDNILKKCSFQNFDNNFIKKAIDFGYGIRLLNQDHFETIISFVISQNNNIKRIQKIVEEICQKFGTDMGEFYAFPTLKQLEKISEQDFKQMGAGYRAQYLVDTIKFLKTFDDTSFQNQSLESQLDVLLSVKGIGPKVADCILLFAYHNMHVFPVDTWIEKVYNQYFSNKNIQNLSRLKIRQNLTQIFGEFSGYIQQYLFYFQRSKL